MSIPIRRLSNHRPEATRYLPHHEIADSIAQGHAEPDITIGDYNPPLPSEWLSLAEAFDLYINRHPDLREHDNARIVGQTIALGKFVERPTWSGTADIDKLRRLAGLRPLKARGKQRRGDGTIPESSPGPRVISIEELENELEIQLGRYSLNLVIHNFLMHLLNGHLQATGVWEGDLATLERQDVPGNWWSRDIVVRIPDCEIWEQTGANRRGRERRWSDVKVSSNDTAGIDDGENDSVPLSSGGPGRPTSMQLIELQFEERVEQHILEPTLKAESEFLATWLKKTHPKAPRATAKTIQNHLRHRYRSEKKKTSKKEAS